MEACNPQPDVETIIKEIRQGMADTESSSPSDPEEARLRGLRGSLRKATETSDVLGRCGGSIRGKLCQALAPVLLPVVEQLNMHHAAVVAALNQLRGDQSQTPPPSASTIEALEARIRELEKTVETLKAGTQL